MAAGVGRQTIYRWWPTRSALVMDALVEITDDSMKFIITGDLEADLRRQMRSMVKTFAGPAGSLLKELVGSAQFDPELAERLCETFLLHRRDQIRAFIAAAKTAGALSEVNDIDAFAYSLYAPLWLALLLGHEPLTDRTADRALDSVLGSIVVPS